MARQTREDAVEAGHDHPGNLLAVLVSGENPDGSDYRLPVELPAPAGWEYKSVDYANIAAWQAGLAAEVAAGWEPMTITALLVAAAERLVALYRRAL